MIILINKKKAETKALRRSENAEKVITEKPSEKKKKPANLFEELYVNNSESDNEEKRKVTTKTAKGKQEVEEFPALFSTTLKRTEMPKVSYASALTKVPEVVETIRKPNTVELSKDLKQKTEQIKLVLPIPKLIRAKVDQNVPDYNDNFDDYLPYINKPSILKASEMDWAALDSESDSDDDYVPLKYFRD